MRSLDWQAFFWLLRKEWRELLVSRSWWLMLLLMGPITGLSFIAAVQTYAEVSGLNGTAAGVGEALAPLVGVWAPTFSGLELAAVFLLPFVAIRIAGADGQSGALKLELQRTMPLPTRTAAKFVVAMAGWLVAMLPAVSTLLLWVGYGGQLYAPEIATLFAGHVLNAGLTIALAAAAASVASHPSTAAIVTLAITVGTWLLNIFAALQGGLWERAAAFTPAAIVADFQHGLLRLDATMVALILIVMALGLACLWQQIGLTTARRMGQSAVLAGCAAAALFAATGLRASWDLSEARANSFPLADEAALRAIPNPLEIEVHLAAEDPRRVDLERSTLSKLRRLMPRLQVKYSAASKIGIFEQTAPGYGEIHYRYGSRHQSNLLATADGMLETIYEITGVQPSQSLSEPVYRGRPLAARPTGAATVFYFLWPGLVLLSSLLVRRRLYR